MSNALAIASVTAVLKDLLNNGVIDHQLSGVLGEVVVSALPPDRVLVSGQPETSRINLFLYRVAPNAGWRNEGLPSRDSNGDRVSNPPLGLDLHYLITTYGAGELHSEILLGYALQLLHETPVLTRDAIRRTLAPASPVTGSILPPPMNALVASELADQVEAIRLIPQTLSTDEVSKLWTAIQSHYRPTAAYQASVVLIESRLSTRSALPVANDRRRLYVVPFLHPAIDDAVSADGDRAPIVAGGTLEIRGRDLRGDVTLVDLDGHEIAPAASAISPEKISVKLATPLPAGLYAGVKTVRVVHRLKMGDPEADHRGFESNVAAFVLRPSISNGPVIGADDVIALASTTAVIDGATVQLRSGKLRIDFVPDVGRDQRVSLLWNEFQAAPGAKPHAYTFTAPAGNGLPDGVDEAGSIDVPFSGVVAGAYLVRARVDGAESVLLQNGAGLLATPRVVLP